MDENKEHRKDEIENLEVEALNDADLESVSGGGNNINNRSEGSTSCCGSST
jgi:hypothetical protein